MAETLLDSETQKDAPPLAAPIEAQLGGATEAAGEAPSPVGFPSQDDLYSIDAAANPTRRGFLAGSVGMIAAVIGRRALAAGGGGAPVYRIHPAIGVARVGNADPDTYFIGPEIPGLPPLGQAPGTAAPPYKAGGMVKPQAVRFRVYEYNWIGGRLTPVREVTLSTPGVLGITWTAHLANKKAAFYRFRGLYGSTAAPAALRNATETDRRSLEIDFGPRSIGGASQGPAAFTPGTSADPDAESCPLDASGEPVIDYLGQIRTDSEGRLILLGGKGAANYNTAAPPEIASYANNDGWFDDISDGPVTAVVTISDGAGGSIDVPVDAAGGAWALVAPPDFAPGVAPAITLYDVLYDMAVRQLPIPLDSALYDSGGPLYKLKTLATLFQPLSGVELPGYVPDFYEEIQPIFARGYEYRWVTALVDEKHNGLVSPKLADPSAANAKLRTSYLEHMRPPEGTVNPAGSGAMPRVLGDEPYISQLPDGVQRLSITRTQYGLLRNWAKGQFTAPAPVAQPAVITPHGLDRAQLEWASGGAFYPGIEAGWQIRSAALFIEPFRLDLGATSAYWGENGTIGPGHFSRQMALPWHADFNECKHEGNYAWWPAQRPDNAFPSVSAARPVDWSRPTVKFAGGNRESTMTDMLTEWYKFGFIVEQGGKHVETERAAQIP